MEMLDNEAMFLATIGVLNSSGKLWLEQRRFTLRTLRDFGFGKQTQQNLALEEVRDMVDRLKASEGKSTLLYNTFDLPTVNSLWTIMTSKRFLPDDPVLTEFLRKSNEYVVASYLFMHFA